MVLVRLHQLWYSTVEMKRGSFHQNQSLFVVISKFFTQCQPSKGENDTVSDVYYYLNENKHDRGIREGFNSLPDDNV